MPRKLGRGRPKKNPTFRSKLGRIMRKTMRFAPIVHNIKEKCRPVIAQGGGFNTGLISAAANSTLADVLTFQLSDLNNVGAFKALYDLYKIVKVKITFMPQWNSADVSLPNARLPILYVAQNKSIYSVPPASIDDILNDDGVRIVRLDKPFKMTVNYPKVKLVDSAGAPTNQVIYNNLDQPWLSTGGNSQVVDQSGQAHYGVRWLLDNSNYNDNAIVKVFFTYYLKFKEQD